MANRFIKLYLLLPFLLCGCGQKTVKNSGAVGPTFDVTAELNLVREGLRKPHPDPDHLRGVLQRLGNVIVHEPSRKPAPLTPEATQQIKKAVGLNDDDVKEITRAEFTALDGAILDQALLFRDVAKTLNVEGQDVATKALVALAWVTRHIMLVEHAGPPFPPEFVVTQGRGSGLERIYVYLALLQQLGIRAYAVGDDGSGHDPGKLWGVAVGDLPGALVVDPRIGLPLPGATANKPVTLAEIQAHPEYLKNWWECGYDVSAERIKSANLYWGLPASTFAPRLQAVEALFPAKDLHLTTDVATMSAVVAWDSRTIGTPLRVLAEFTPEGEGGTERAERLPSGQILSQRNRIQNGMLPWQGLPPELLLIYGRLGQQIRLTYENIAGFDQLPGLAEMVLQIARLLESAKILKSHDKEITDDRQRDDIAKELLAAQRRRGADAGPTLRELLLRGQDANEVMGLLRGQLQKISTQSAALAGERAMSELVAIIGEALAAQKAGNEAGVAAANKKLTDFKDVQQVLAAVQARAASQMLTRLQFLTSLTKHDLADVSSRRDPAKKAEIWQTPTKLWDSFLTNNPDAMEANHARRCFAEALRNAGDAAAAQKQFEQVAASNVHPMDKVACAIMAKP